jgi:hypothetical protein
LHEIVHSIVEVIETVRSVASANIEAAVHFGHARFFRNSPMQICNKLQSADVHTICDISKRITISQHQKRFSEPVLDAPVPLAQKGTSDFDQCAKVSLSG